MDINLVLKEFDALFRQASPEEIHTFLTEHIRIAELERDQGSLLTLLNEQIGFARETNREDIVLESGKRLLDLLSEMGIEGTVPYGSSLLNIANAYRAYGHYADSEVLFQKAVIRQATSRGNLAVVLLDLAKECEPELSKQRRNV